MERATLSDPGQTLRTLIDIASSSKHAAAGTHQFWRSRSGHAACGADAAVFGNKRALSFGDGRRGVQEANRLSKSFQFSFIIFLREAGSQLLQSVPVAACHGIWREFE